MTDDEVSTEALLVVVGSDLHDEPGTSLGRRIKRRANCIRSGTKLGRRRRQSYPESRRSFSSRQTSISPAKDMSTAPTALPPVKVKLLSWAATPDPGSLPLPMPRARPMRSQTRKIQTASTFPVNSGRRHHARFRLCQAAQLTKNRMCRPSSCMTGSKVSTSVDGKNPERFASANKPKAKKLSMHSL